MSEFVRKSSRPRGRSRRAASRDPGVGVAPQRRAVLGDGEVEARVRQRHVLGRGVVQREREAVLRLHRAGGLELLRGEVDADRARPAAGEPGGDVGGAAAQLDHVQAVDRRQRADLGLRHVPGAPADLARRPVAPRGLDVVDRIGVPGRLVAARVVGQRAPGERDQVDAGDRRPVAPGIASEAEPLVDAVRRAHRGLAGADEARPAAPSGLIEDVPQQRGPDAAALAGGRDGEHPELRLAVLRDLAQCAAVGHEGDRAEQLAALLGDEHLRGRGPRGDVAQHVGVPVRVGVDERRVGGDAEVGDGAEFGGLGWADQERHGRRARYRLPAARPPGPLPSHPIPGGQLPARRRVRSP